MDKSHQIKTVVGTVKYFFTKIPLYNLFQLDELVADVKLFHGNTRQSTIERSLRRLREKGYDYVVEVEEMGLYKRTK